VAPRAVPTNSNVFVGNLNKLAALVTSGAGIAQGYGLDDGRFESRAGAGNFSLHHRVQTSSGTHLVSCPMDKRGSFPAGKAAWE